jgi:plastocyanin
VKRAVVLAVVSILLAGGLACSRDDAGKTASDVYNEAKEGAREAANRAEDVVNDRTVEIKDIAYHPATRTVKMGTEVTWLNHDAVTHTVTADNGAFDSDTIAGTKEFSFRFTMSGVYSYHCEIHGKDRMSGKIVVE